MSVSRISKAMGYIDDELISEAESYKPKSSFVITTIKVAAVVFAACLVIAMIIKPQPKPDFTITYTSTTSANAEALYAHEIYDHKVFGDCFPTEFADNYFIKGKIYIYDNTLEAEFYNHFNLDTIYLHIFPKKYLPQDEVMGRVLYPQNKNSDITSYIWVDMGQYAAKFSSEKCDLATLEGFNKMIKSTK